MGGIIKLCAWSRSAPASWASGGAFSTRHKRGLAGACAANEWRTKQAAFTQPGWQTQWPTWALRPRPRYCCSNWWRSLSKWCAYTTPKSTAAPHLRVVSRKGMGKSCPTRPDRQGGSFPCTSGRSRYRCQGRSRRRSRTFCQFRVALPPSTGLTCSVRL